MWISTSFRWLPVSRLYTPRVYLHYTLNISICETVGHWSVTGVRHFLCLLLHLASVRMSIMYFFIYRYSMNTLLHFDKNFAFLSQFVFMLTEYYQNVVFEKLWLGSVCPVTALWLKIDRVKFSLEILYLQGRLFFSKTPENEPNSLYNLFFLQRFQWIKGMKISGILNHRS